MAHAYLPSVSVIVTDIQKPILWADFLHLFSLSEDMKRHQITDGITQSQGQDIVTKDLSPSRTLVYKDHNNPYLTLLSKYPAITLRINQSNTNVTHHISTTGPPVSARPRRLAPDRMHITKQEFKHMLKLGIIVFLFWQLKKTNKASGKGVVNPK